MGQLLSKHASEQQFPEERSGRTSSFFLPVFIFYSFSSKITKCMRSGAYTQGEARGMTPTSCLFIEKCYHSSEVSLETSNPIFPCEYSRPLTLPPLKQTETQEQMYLRFTPRYSCQVWGNGRDSHVGRRIKTNLEIKAWQTQLMQRGYCMDIEFI